MAGPATKLERISRYASVYEADYRFEAVLVAARQRTVLEHLTRWQPRVVVEAGCGDDLLFSRADQAGVPFDRWVIVEPSPRFAEVAEAHAAGTGGRIVVIRSFLEDAVEDVVAACPRPADVVLCSSVLHEVADPRTFLDAARRMLAADGRAYIDVPNARSLHRRLARAMGLIADETELSARNLTFEQDRVYDACSLRHEIEGSGLQVLEEGGHFIKPFTHGQMEQLGFADERMVEGLRILGQELPDLAAEIFCVAEPGA
ncbi:MAG TPA: methyltransferase domain-containing protein [Acidimicrobiales bacterium]|nr:methyltransferase domain-containing protein [Acidimicrobiales bacterium]